MKTLKSSRIPAGQGPWESQHLGLDERSGQSSFSTTLANHVSVRSPQAHPYTHRLKTQKFKHRNRRR